MNKMYFEVKLFSIREELSFTSSTSVFMNLIIRYSDERVTIVRTTRSLISSPVFYGYDTDRHSQDMVSFGFDDHTIDNTMR
jgi:hypothetical protein